MDDILSNQTKSSDLSQRETWTLIAASKVKGTSVYDHQRNSLGAIYDVMLDKRRGTVAYAVLSFGGFLGIGDKYHPLPWNKLHYDGDLGGYVVDVDQRTLEAAPAYNDADAPDWSTPAYGEEIDRYYGGLPTIL